jgi:hypothetical protein
MCGCFGSDDSQLPGPHTALLLNGVNQVAQEFRGEQMPRGWKPGDRTPDALSDSPWIQGLWFLDHSNPFQ